MSPDDKNRNLKSITKTFKIINVIVERDGARISEVAADLDMAKSTVHIHLQSLLDQGFLLKKESVYYAGLKFLDVGIQARERLPIMAASRLELESLAEKTGETVWLFTEEHGQCVYLDIHTGDQAIHAHGRVGKRENMHYVAGGKAQLAYMSDNKLSKILDMYGLTSKTENTITDERRLLEELEEIREQGYAINDGEEIAGVYAVAAPILSDEEVVGAVSVSGPKNRLEQREKKELIRESVLAAGNTISLRLDYN